MKKVKAKINLKSIVLVHNFNIYPKIKINANIIVL